MSVNRLLIYDASQVVSDTNPIDSEETYGIVVLDIDGQDTREVQNISTQTWYDEDGEDAFYPAKVTFKAYDVDVTLGVKDDGTDKARDIKHDFINAIVGKELIIEQEYVNSIMCGCYVSKVEDDEFGDDFLTFKVTFRVTKPTESTSLPKKSVVYSNPTINFEYPLHSVNYKGATYYVSTRSFLQTKTTTYSDSTTKAEAITSGGTWTFAISKTPSSADVTIDANTGAITFGQNTSSSAVNVTVTATCTANGVSSTATFSFVQGVGSSKMYYVGQTTANASDFAELSASELVSSANAMSSASNSTVVTSWIYYIMLPSDVTFKSLTYTSNGITSTLSASDFNCSHSSVTYNSKTYTVYALRTSPQSLTYNLTVTL